MQFSKDHPLVIELISEVDRAVKQAMNNKGTYTTSIRFILDKHLGHCRGAAHSERPDGRRGYNTRSHA